MEFLRRKVPAERNNGQLRRHGGEDVLSSYALEILHKCSLKPESNSPDTLRAISIGNMRRTTVTTRLPTDEDLDSSWKNRVNRVRKDKKIASLCMQIQNLRDAIRTAEWAENRNIKEIDQIRSERKALQRKVHLLMRA